MAISDSIYLTSRSEIRTHLNVIFAMIPTDGTWAGQKQE